MTASRRNARTGRFRTSNTSTLVPLWLLLVALVSNGLQLANGAAATAATSDAAARAATTTGWIVPGAVWTDSEGQVIQAHGGGIYAEGGTFYWVGEDKTLDTTSSTLRKGLHMYSSTDLRNWQDRGLVFTAPQGKVQPGDIGERPKIIKSRTTGQYLLYFHHDTPPIYSTGEVAVATSSSITGPYKLQGTYLPGGQQCRDFNLFVDDDAAATGYIVCTRNYFDLAIVRLSDDYTRPVGGFVYSENFAGIEGHGMFKSEGVYHLFSSHETIWAPNNDVVRTAKSLSGPWSAPAELATRASLNTYNSQNNFDLVVRGSRQTSYIYMGDRWRQDILSNSTYVWMPLKRTPDGATFTIDRTDVWRIDTATGEVSKPTASRPYNAASPADAKLGFGVTTGGCSACPGGSIAQWVGDLDTADVRFEGVATPSGKAGKVWISIYYVSPELYPTYRSASISANGGAPQTVLFPPGGSAGEGLQSAPVELELRAGATNTVRVAKTPGAGPVADISHIVVYQTA